LAFADFRGNKQYITVGTLAENRALRQQVAVFEQTTASSKTRG
jgi:hypothetical protein